MGRNSRGTVLPDSPACGDAAQVCVRPATNGLAGGSGTRRTLRGIRSDGRLGNLVLQMEAHNLFASLYSLAGSDRYLLV